MAAGAATAQAAGKPGGVNNTAYLFFVLALAFLFFVTIKGDLPKWLGLLGLGGSPAGAAATSPASTGAPATGNLPGLPGIPTLGQTSAANPLLNTSTFGGTGTEANTYTGPTYIDTTSGF